jgi:hypothetical protein
VIAPIRGAAIAAGLKRDARLQIASVQLDGPDHEKRVFRCVRRAITLRLYASNIDDSRLPREYGAPRSSRQRRNVMGTSCPGKKAAPCLRAGAGLIEVIACELIGQQFIRIRKALRS